MRVCCAGEVMLEMAAVGEDALYRRGVAGDSFNTAVYLARAGLAVSYLTRLGDDPLSDHIVDRLAAEGIDRSLVTRCRGRRPGLYLIDNAADGERRFHYWRGESPARELFLERPALPRLDLFYFTGITLAVTRDGLGGLLATLEDLARAGCRVVFDPNYRPALWTDREEARRHCRAVLPHCHTVLATLEDETALWDLHDVETCRAFYAGRGVREIVVRAPDLESDACSGAEHARRRAEPVTAADTTGAGDSFNAGYLAARLGGADLDTSLAAAQRLAAQVVQHRGAIMPRQPAD